MDTSPSLHRTGFGLKKEVQRDLACDYHSNLVNTLRASGNVLTRGRITIKLAKEFGFCYGVDKAVDLAYETRRKFPNKRIFLITEIIHNPMVNKRLQEMGIRFIGGPYGGQNHFNDITPQDVVILPAFGATIPDLKELKNRGCILVDTTCGSVINVWRRVEKYAATGFTVVIHGKYSHEETLATSSRVLQHPQGRYLVVRDKDQAQKLANYILGGGKRDAILKEFKDACSPQFDPESDLIRIGLANQTTMLSSESQEIAKMLQQAMREHYGKDHLAEHFQNFETICSATQDRQDAVLELIQGGVDLMIVIGGYNSSNTGHLCKIAAEVVPAFHIQDAGDVLSGAEISHRDPKTLKVVTTCGWLTTGPKIIGVTAGASTPSRVVGEVIEKLTACQ